MCLDVKLCSRGNVVSHEWSCLELLGQQRLIVVSNTNIQGFPQESESCEPSMSGVLEVFGINPCLGMSSQAPGYWRKEGHKYIFLSPQGTEGQKGSAGR